MATGRPMRYATARIEEPIHLSTPGIRIVIWDKWGKTRRGTAVVSVGGIRWYPYKAKNPHKITWDELDDLAQR
jgi:hypothetical protein